MICYMENSSSGSRREMQGSDGNVVNASTTGDGSDGFKWGTN